MSEPARTVAAFHSEFAIARSIGPMSASNVSRTSADLAACRTAYFGCHLTQCDHCERQVYRYHSCGNRHCPTCHGPRTERWLETQRAQLLPCPYYLVTFTLPRELRALAFAHQRVVYGVLMRSAAAALQRLAADPRYVGARLWCLAVLHTWTRAMLYHPHVHLLVTAGGLSPDGTQWIAPKNPAFLVPVQALSVIFRAKVCAGLRRAGGTRPGTARDLDDAVGRARATCGSRAAGARLSRALRLPHRDRQQSTGPGDR
jgi:hypothetical protein